MIRVIGRGFYQACDVRFLLAVWRCVFGCPVGISHLSISGARLCFESLVRYVSSHMLHLVKAFRLGGSFRRASGLMP